MTAMYEDREKCAELARAGEGVELGMDWWERVSDAFEELFVVTTPAFGRRFFDNRDEYVGAYGEDRWSELEGFHRRLGDLDARRTTLEREVFRYGVCSGDSVTVVVRLRMSDQWGTRVLEHLLEDGELMYSGYYARYEFTVSGVHGMTDEYIRQLARERVGAMFYHVIEEYWAMRNREGFRGTYCTPVLNELDNGAVRLVQMRVERGTSVDGFANIDAVCEVFGRRFEAMFGCAVGPDKLAMMRQERDGLYWDVVYHPDGMRTASCSSCGQAYTAGPRGRYTSLVLDSPRGFVCVECLDTTGVCLECGRRRPLAEMYNVGERFICAEEDDECGGYCSHVYHRCSCCEEVLVSGIDDYEYDINEDVVCDDCAGDYYVHCDRCGELVHTDYANYDDDREEYYCGSCYEEYSSCRIRGYSYKPEPVFKGVSDDGLYFGLEIETDCGEGGSFAHDCGGRFGDTMYFKSDGSLSDSGVECVTHPMSYDYAIGFDWDEFHRIACDNDMRSHDTSTCGFHIHVSRDGLGRSWAERELTAAKLVMFFDHYRGDLLAFSRRRRSSAEEWARSNEAGIRADDTREKACEKAKDSSEYSRYCAVNLRNTATVEIRLWRGTTNPATIRSTIDMTNAIVRYCMGTELRELCTPESLWDCVSGLIRDETKGYMTLRGLNPEADTPRADGSED